MSNFFDPAVNAPPNRLDDSRGYQMYNHQYNNAPYQRLSGPSSHFDGVAFWYRPDTQEPLYDHDPSLYDQTSGIPQGAMEAAGVKHRRTRSGCFTCRSRRVKVSFSQQIFLQD
jgi:hypothetical protein